MSDEADLLCIERLEAQLHKATEDLEKMTAAYKKADAMLSRNLKRAEKAVDKYGDDTDLAPAARLHEAERITACVRDAFKGTIVDV